MKSLSDKKTEEFIEKHGGPPHHQPTYGDGMMYTLVALSTLYNLHTNTGFDVVDWGCYAIAIVISFIELRRQIVYRTKMEQVKKDLLGLLDAIKD